MIYLDHCATSPLDPAARRGMLDALDAFASPVGSPGEAGAANPSSVHGAGRRARAMLGDAREAVARFLGASPGEIVFVGSGSEANNLALKGAALRDPSRPFRIVLSRIEHESVVHTARWLATRSPGVEVVELDSDPAGVVRPEEFREALAAPSLAGGVRALVCVMAVNNETGARQPVEAIAAIARETGALLLCDAVQAAGRLPLPPLAGVADLLSVSAHKIGGPRGVGCLFVRRGVKIDALIHGGHQETDRRAGTEGVEAAAGFAGACAAAAERMDAEREKMRTLDREFLETLRDTGAAFALNADGPARVPGVLNVSLPGARSHDLVAGMDLRGFAVSAGSACSSGAIEPSRTLIAAGLPAERVESAVRVSFGPGNTVDQARAAARALAEVARALALGAAAFETPDPGGGGAS